MRCGKVAKRNKTRFSHKCATRLVDNIINYAMLHGVLSAKCLCVFHTMMPCRCLNNLIDLLESASWRIIRKAERNLSDINRASPHSPHMHSRARRQRGYSQKSLMFKTHLRYRLARGIHYFLV